MINTLIILDWDDTLFPTTWIMKNNININEKGMRKLLTQILYKLDIVLYNFLTITQRYGKIIIVTNALPVWVKISSSVLPKTHELIKKIKIVSAKKNYKTESNKMMDWKKLAFRDEVTNEIINNNINNVISIGDAEYEYYALIDLYKTTKGSKILKSIKLMGKPDYEILMDQLKVLSNSIQIICNKQTHLDLVFKINDNM